MRQPFDLRAFCASLSLQQQLDRMSEAERKALTPNSVDQEGWSEDTLGQRRFCQALQDRRDWIATNCLNLHFVDPIRDDRMRLTGRRFRFADKNEAFSFKMRFG